MFKFCKTELNRPMSCPLFWHITSNKWQTVCHIPPVCFLPPNNWCLLLLIPWQQLSFLLRWKRRTFWMSVFLFQPLLTVGLQKYSMLSLLWQTASMKQSYKFWFPTEMKIKKKKKKSIATNHHFPVGPSHLGTYRKT